MEEIRPRLRQDKSTVMTIGSKGWTHLARLAPLLEYPARISLFDQETQASEIYLIESGLIKLIFAEPEDNELVVGLRTPGSMLGVASVILSKPYPFSAQTLTACKLRRLSGNLFLNLLKTNSEVGWYLHQAQSHEVYNQLTQLVGIGCLSARHRLELLLVQLIDTLPHQDGDKQIRFKLPLKHWELAELIAVTPEHLSRVLKEMQNEGIVLKEKDRINIVDIQILRRATECL